MTIEGIGPIQPNQPVNRTGRAQEPQRSAPSDSVAFSDEARLKADVYRLQQDVRATDDVRADRIAEAKAKLQDPSYLNDAVLNTVADRVMDVFGLS
ncbi:MAG: flagellar biosynthesis anti-sigma factor FlgM [Spirochaetaceae bacterium]|nr:MAG: flagellar biosynthesis anti-sigma factor FlgM [Spirochaetaceae bacterium]